MFENIVYFSKYDMLHLMRSVNGTGWSACQSRSFMSCCPASLALSTSVSGLKEKTAKAMRESLLKKKRPMVELWSKSLEAAAPRGFARSKQLGSYIICERRCSI